PSGCGKTTTLRMLAGFIRPDGGQILIDGHDVTDLPPERRPTAMVFQSYALWPHMTVADNVAFGLRLRKLARNVVEERTARMLDVVGLPGVTKRYPSQLSGGQQQRVALATALVLGPKILLRADGTAVTVSARPEDMEVLRAPAADAFALEDARLVNFGAYKRLLGRHPAFGQLEARVPKSFRLDNAPVYVRFTRARAFASDEA